MDQDKTRRGGPTPAEGATLTQICRALDQGALSSERLVARSLARIAAYDRQGPTLLGMLAINPRALDEARTLDAERKARGPRSPLHGVPVVVKDNIDTADMPTTAGSVLLEGSIPPDDAEVVRRLRSAGAVILGKTNTSEFALSSYSSLGGRPRNPHDLGRTTTGSSNGVGVAVAAAYAPLGVGTDTGGSIRGPASACGVVGLKPTYGLVSCDGVIPLAASLDVVGLMGRSVDDIALGLGVIAPDALSAAPPGGSGALAGAGIGVARDFLGQDREVDWVVEAALDAMRQAGARLVDVRFPRWLLDSKQEFYLTIRHSEFAAQIGDYLATTGVDYPKSLSELIARAAAHREVRQDGAGPNPSRWATFRDEQTSPPLDDYRYRSIREFGMPMVRAAVEGLFAAEALDAIAFPPMPSRPGLISQPDGVFHGPAAPTNIANLAGLPELVITAGFTSDALPVGLSLMGRSRTEATLIALGSALELRLGAPGLPRHTPPLEPEDPTA